MEKAFAEVPSPCDQAERTSRQTVSLLRTDALLERITQSAADAADAYRAVLPAIDTLLQT